MGIKNTHNQLLSVAIYNLYIQQILMLASNLYIYRNLPQSINLRILTYYLTKFGSVAFFYDEVLEEYIVLPYNSIGTINKNNEPTKIEAYSPYNNYHIILTDFVIIYDNILMQSFFIYYQQFGLRLANIQRIMDVNIMGQKTPRFWKVPQEQAYTYKKALNDIDADVDTVITYSDSDLNLEGTEATQTMEPAKMVLPELRQEKKEIWNEIYEFLGISHLQYNKRERFIESEIISSDSATIAYRNTRFQSRKDAIEKINKKYNISPPIEVEFYDSLPTTRKEELIDDSNSTITTNVI